MIEKVQVLIRLSEEFEQLIGNGVFSNNPLAKRWGQETAVYPIYNGFLMA